MKMKRTAKRAVSVLLSLILILSVFTILPIHVSAWTTVNISYLDLDGSEQLIQMVRKYNGETHLDGSMYAVIGNWTINSRIICSGNIKLVLANDVTLTAHKGITVEEGSSLTIWQEEPEEGKEPGKLVVDQTEDDYAGIGSVAQGSCGEITINGGTVTVTGGANGAGIGGTNSTVTINRGTVTATGGANAAGIGGANSTVTVNGGDVTATGGSQGTGIVGDTIALNNGEIPYGEVSVTSDSYSGSVTLGVDFFADNGICYPAGAVSDNSILAGRTLKLIPWCIPYIDEDGAEQLLTPENYTDITSSTGTLTDGWYVVREDIENNNRLYVSGSVNLLLCSGTTFYAHKGITVNFGKSLTIWEQKEDGTKEAGKLIVNQCSNSNAGIGGSSGYTGGNITINGGTVSSRGGQNGAGIGGGYRGKGGNITINGGNVTALSESDAAGIGGGQGASGGTITINGGTVNAAGGRWGAGIGGGAPEYSKAVTEDIPAAVEHFGDGGTIIINGGTVSAIGGAERAAGIGGGKFSNGGNVTISGGTVTASGSTGIGCGWGANGGSVTLKWTEETRSNMSVYPRGCNVNVTLESGFIDGNGNVYGPGSYDGGTIANKTLTPISYTVTWKNYDGTILKIDENVDGGAIPTYVGTTPVKPSDGNHSYVFSGWTPELSSLVANTTYTATFIKSGVFVGHSLTLEGDIGINFYAALTDEELGSGAVVDFAWTVEGEEKTHSVTLTADDNTANGYKATCPVAVAEMTYDVTATLTIGGVEYDTDTYSVKQYGDTILSNDYKTEYLKAGHTEAEYNKLATLVKTMLNYGAKAQVVFKRNTGNLANNGVDYTMAAVTDNMITTTPSDMNAGLDDYGLAYAGTTVVYLSKTSMRHYYTITDQTKFNAVKDNIFFNGNKVNYKTKDGKIYFELTNIAAADLDTPYTLTIGESSYDYAVLDYVRACINADDVPRSTFYLVCATYWYNQAANDWFGR